MPDFDLFDLYRFLLASLVCVYVTVRLVAFIWQWQGFGRGGRIGSALLRRYLIVLLLRVRLRRFAYEFVVTGGLAAVLVLLLRMHWR